MSSHSRPTAAPAHNPNRKVTPPDQIGGLNPALAALKLDATPSNNMGSTSNAVSEGYEDYKVDHVKEWIANDLEKHEKCSVDDMLAYFLRQCLHGQTPASKDTSSTFLQPYLEAVLPICNNDQIMNQLTEYCKIGGTEQDRYRPFVELFNLALQKLRSVKVPNVRSANGDLEILFHRNDPKMIQGDHNGDVSKRSPDVVLVSLAAAQGASDSIGTQWWDATGLALEQPFIAFDWPQILCVFEFKRVAKTLTPPPPKHSGFGAVREPQQNVWNLFNPVPDPSGATSAEANPDGDGSEATGANSGGGGKRPRATSASSSERANKKPRGRSANLVPPKIHNTRGNSALANQPPSASSARIAQDVKVKKKPVERPKPPIVQCGMYGAEMLSRGPCVNHAINVLIIDDVMWIWWYDRQGAIQTQGINFVQDLPRFLILLFAFQRFKLEDWGFNTILDPQSEIVHDLKKVHQTNRSLPKSHFVFPPPELSVSAPVEATIDPNSQIHHVYSLVGRGTSVFSGTACTKAPPTRDSRVPQGSGKGPAAVDDISFATLDKDEKVVVKIYWPEESRLSEGRIISEAYKRGEGNLDIVEHLPKMYLEHDFPEHSTNHIRDALRLTRPDGRRATRILRLAVFLKLDPIIALCGEEFMKAYLDCVRCHFALWTLGIQHSDLSLSNVMINDQKRGILNDWDLATIEGISKHDGCDRTGTVPFMALDLLKPSYWEGKIKRQYHHDLEGFLWILPYVCLQYKDGKMVTNPLKSWNTGHYAICREKKRDFLANLRTDPTEIPKATSSYEWEWVVFDQFVQCIDNNWQSPLTGTIAAATKQKKADLAMSVLNPGDIYAEFWARMKMAAEDDSGHLLYLKKYVPDGF